MTVVVTGGNGYIGSHVVRLLLERGERVLIVDTVAEPNQNTAAGVIECDLSAPGVSAELAQLFQDEDVESVVHLAARKQVGESMQKPLWYYQQNIAGQMNLMAAMEQAGVLKFVFSSSAAVYGIPDGSKATEATEPKPINPYGQTKLVGEWMSANQARAAQLRQVSLRYFNVAGAGWDELGDPYALNLIPIVFDKLEKGLPPRVFGDDYPTVDGTCIRDYVHVLDLAQAHLAALDYLDQEQRAFEVFNVGTGTGSSVFQVLDEIRRVTGENFAHKIAERRAGDPPALTASVDRIHTALDWKAQHDLSSIVESAWSAKQFRTTSAQK